MIQRGGNRNFRYTPNARNTPDVSVPPQGLMGAMLPVPLEIGGVPVASADSGNNQPLPISALSSALASAPPEQQRAVRFWTSPCLPLSGPSFGEKNIAPGRVSFLMCVFLGLNSDAG